MPLLSPKPHAELLGAPGAFGPQVAMVDTTMFNRRATETFALRSSMCSEWGTPSTRALHLLLKMSTGHSDVQLNRFIHRNKLRRGPRYLRGK